MIPATWLADARLTGTGKDEVLLKKKNIPKGKNISWCWIPPYTRPTIK